MAESTSDAAADKPRVPLPEIPECDLRMDDAGVYHLTHRGTGDTETADTPRDVVLKGAMLRILAAHRREPNFTTGDING